MMHLELHADSAGITAELTVLGILSYHESLLSEAITAALACALSAFVVGTSPGRTKRRGRARTRGSYPSGPNSCTSGPRERAASSSQMCRHCGAVPCRHIDVVQPPKLPRAGSFARGHASLFEGKLVGHARPHLS